MSTAQHILISFGLPILAGIACFAYVATRAKAARAHVSAFCNTVQLGAPVEGIADRARSDGLTVHEFRPRDGKGALMIQDGVLLARHYCTLDYEQGKISHKDQSFVD